MFALSSGQEVNGTLTLTRRDIVLYVWSEVPLDVVPGSTITGVLDDLTHASLLQCSVRSEGHSGRDHKVRYTYHLSPLYLLIGSRYFSDRDEELQHASFIVAHSVELFDDPDAYGTIFHDPEAVRRAAQGDIATRTIKVNDWNWVSYYTGKTNVFRADTSIGEISANHSPTFTMGHASSLGLTKRVYFNIKFDVPVSVVEALFRIDRVLQFIDLIVGYSENVEEMHVYAGSDCESREADVHSLNYSRRRQVSTQRRPSKFTALIHPVDQAEEFSNALSNWIERDLEWRTARMRLSRDWGTLNYTYSRMITAANAFDLLPGEIYGDATPLSQKERDAVERAKMIFRALPPSEDRDIMLGQLGRFGNWPLKRKIRHRARIITDIIDRTVPDLSAVIDQAVNLRNFHVHGSGLRLDDDDRRLFLRFFTDALEFVFFVSDLIEAGWDIVRWCGKGSPRGHPFHNFLVFYRDDLARLKRAIE
ncbi:MAG: hypothetical protein OXH96_01490 [Spirochaetaceae bacterium]|nr:hypothetical protein [Spirochaetaceae bacterium]